MEESFVATNCSSQTLSAQLGVVFTIAWSVIVFVRFRNSKHWTGIAPFAAALVVAALTSVAAWLGIENVIRGMSTMRSPQLGAAVAAGLAEVHGYVLFGVVAGAIAHAFLLVVALRHRREQSAASPRHRTIVLTCAGLAAVAVIGVVAARYLLDTIPPFTIAIAGAMLIVALALIVMTFLSRKGPPAWRWHLRALSFVLVAHIIAGSALWIAMKRLMRIAMGG